MASIAEVAKRAGVARSTVSKALNGTRPVHPATRERILAAVAELGYRPNATARNLRARRTRTVALSIPLDIPGRSLGRGPFAPFLECIADRLNERDYKLLCLVSRSPEADELVRLAREGHSDGLLLLQIRLHDARLSALRAEGLPFVAMGRCDDQPDLAWVDTDLEGAADLAVRHLLEGGHRRLAFLGAQPIFGYQYYALKGFKRAHEVAGLPLRPEDLLPYDPATGVQVALRPFLRDDGPTALITTADLEAVEALHFFSEHGLRVPDEVALVTLGDSPLTQLAKPSVTAVLYAIEDYCRYAVDLVIDLIEGKDPPRRQILLPETLIQRESSMPATRHVDPVSGSGQR
ncbi:MAG TPA: LacI family DNA-binding transcriptional regulator [Chloroflexota bacterium]|nr:LacI family DNA-binding transcriptional regulator [Chloroflexota bacterium]